MRLCEAYRSEEALTTVLASLKRAAKQQQLLMRLIELAACEAPDYINKKELPRSALLKESGMSAAILNGLIAKGIVETYVVETDRLAITSEEPVGSPCLAPLSAHQQRASRRSAMHGRRAMCVCSMA